MATELTDKQSLDTSGEDLREIGFVPRLKYLDALILRAMLWPERALVEGTFGTKAAAVIEA